MKNIKNEVLDWLFPRCCPVCHKIIKEKNKMVCPICWEKIQPIRAPYCLKCGKPVTVNEDLCEDCRQNLAAYDRGRGLFIYNEMWKDSILLFKNSGRQEYGNFYAMLLYHYCQRELNMWKVSLIVPVPLSKRKRRMRGFNQAELIARQLSKLCGIPCTSSLIIKTKETRQQKTLNRTQRKQNLKNAFFVNGNVKGMRILLVDDVYTTGSTMDMLAECLKKAGASSVYFLTVCVGTMQ